MSSNFDFSARVRSEGKITIPAEIREQMNLSQGEFIEVSIKKSKWYEMLDWSTMNSNLVNFTNFTPQAQNYIQTTYSCDAQGNKWGATT